IYALGLSLLMFFSGYEVEFDAFKDFDINEDNDCKTCKHRRCRHCKHINTIRTVILITVLTYLASLATAIAFSPFMENKKVIGIILLTLLFASTFAGFVVPILTDEGLAHTVIGKILSAIANLSEALSILFLTILMIAIDIDPKYWLILLTVGLILVVFRISQKFAIGKRFGKITEGIDHLATRVIIVLILLLVLLSDLSGGEYIFGAFLAGMIVRQAKFSEKVIHGISQIIYGVFTPMFYIIVGTHINIIELFSEPSSIYLVLLIFFGLLVAEVPMFILLKWFRLSTILPSIILMACTVVVPIAITHIGGPHGLSIFTKQFSECLLLASLLVCIIGSVIFKIFSVRELSR
ncbi:MAG TPA: cation:proton antiporter, partial [Bacilli bacterium]